MGVLLTVTNPRNGLSKIIDTEGYSLSQYLGTFKTYTEAGFMVEVLRIPAASIISTMETALNRLGSNGASLNDCISALNRLGRTGLTIKEVYNATK